jgi:predicted amidophosphoribosyltransferase
MRHPFKAGSLILYSDVLQAARARPVPGANRHCRSCGAGVPLGVKFCTHCGQPLSARPRLSAD